MASRQPIALITTGAVTGVDWHGSFLGTPEGDTEVTIDGRSVFSRYRTYGFTSKAREDMLIWAGSRSG